MGSDEERLALWFVVPPSQDTPDPFNPSDPADPAGTADLAASDLAAERRYLAQARYQLDQMRRRALALEAQGGDAVSAEFLARTLHRRAASLVDDPATTLFFGRTEHDDGSRWYIGRRHVADPEGDPVVVDWRADVSRPFYRASRIAPLGVIRRRRFGLERGRLTGYEDEHLTDPAETDRRSAILAREIERPRIGPMRDIVATIQPEQDEIVRAGVERSVCVQGAPGTGKTAVGLHRAAWLLYAHRDRLSRSGVLVVGPNASFLDHVAAVLPSLGEADVRHSTMLGLVATLPVRGADTVDTAVLKGDARMARVLHRAVWSQLQPVVEPLVLPRGSVRLRVPDHQVIEIVTELRDRGVRYGAARAMLPHRLAHALLVLMEEAGDSPDDRVQDQVARSREVRRYSDSVWPVLTAEKLLFRLLAEPAFLAGCAAGVLDPGEQQALLWTAPPRSSGTARWSEADLVLLDEIRDLLDRTPSLGHVVLDEAQDLSAMQLRAVGRRCSTGSATVLGDLAQGTTPWAARSWSESLAHLGQPDAQVEVLDRGFRVPTAVLELASRLLPLIAPGLSAPVSVRQDPGRLDLVPVPAAQLWPALVRAVTAALRQEGSIGVIVTDTDCDRAATALTSAGVEHERLGYGDLESHAPGAARVNLVPARTAKGLEYDQVVVVEPAAIAAAEPDQRTGLRRLYVVLTRAVSGLTVVHAEPLPGPLADPYSQPS